MNTRLKIKLAFLNSFSSLTLKPSTSLAVAEALQKEEENGAKMLLIFRYLSILLIIPSGLSAQSGTFDILSHLVAGFIYLLFNITHTIVLKISNIVWLHRFNYISVVVDYSIFLGMLLFYWQQNAPQNFNFVLKSPYLVLTILSLLSTILYFRLSLLSFSAFAYFVISMTLIVYAQNTNVPITKDWTEYILGPAIMPRTIIGLNLTMVILLTSISGYAIYRSTRMVKRIVASETHKAQLSRYFSPLIVEEITGSADKIQTGARQKVTVFFADIRNFTALSENSSPDELAKLLTGLRKIQIACIFENHGTLDKFIGDAVMATFGTPRPSKGLVTDSFNGVLCGIQMQKKMIEFNEKRRDDKLSEIRIGIGIHTGQAFVGNIGDETYLEYTTIGDTVNTASRIESMCKVLQTDFLISEEIHTEVNEFFKTEKMPLLKVKGKAQLMQTYRVLWSQTKG